MQLRVLLVDDSDDDRTLFQLACRRTGLPIRCEVMATAASAISYLKSGCSSEGLPDLIVLDATLEEESITPVFWELVRKNGMGRRVPFVVMSGVLSPAALSAFEAVGPDAVIEKPSDFQGLLRMVRCLWSRYSTQSSGGLSWAI